MKKIWKHLVNSKMLPIMALYAEQQKILILLFIMKMHSAKQKDLPILQLYGKTANVHVCIMATLIHLLLNI